MNRETLIENTVDKIRQLPDMKIKEINEFADFLLSRTDDKIIQEGIQKMVSDSKSFAYLKADEDLYSVDDLKERS